MVNRRRGTTKYYKKKTLIFSVQSGCACKYLYRSKSVLKNSKSIVTYYKHCGPASNARKWKTKSLIIS